MSEENLNQESIEEVEGNNLADNVVENVQETKEDNAQDVDPVTRLQSQLIEEKNKYMRLFAEFENFRKRTAKERLDLYSTASEGVVTDLLPVLDDFERAIKELYKDGDQDALKGVELINSKFKKVLENKGLTVMEANVGDTFNTDLHEAVTQIPAPSDELRGKLVDVIEKGYLLNDKVIRFAKVVIGQ